MTSVKERPSRDNPERLYQQLGQLVETVDQAYEQQRAVPELERDLFRQLLAMGYQLLEIFFQRGEADGNRGAEILLEDGRRVRRLAEVHGRGYRSIFGLHRLEGVV